MLCWGLGWFVVGGWVRGFFFFFFLACCFFGDEIARSSDGCGMPGCAAYAVRPASEITMAAFIPAI